jgi:hypothetical protein
MIMLVPGFWFLVAGIWSLVAGCRSEVRGCQRPVTRIQRPANNTSITEPFPKSIKSLATRRLAIRCSCFIVLVGRNIMLNLIIDIIGGICLVGLTWCLFRASLPKTSKNGQAGQAALDGYLRKHTVVTGLSAYDAFRISGQEWRVADDIIEQDFRVYLSSQKIPYYLKDFIRKSRTHIDELYVGSGGFEINKKLAVFFSFFALVFWGGAVFLCVYVFPHILPEDFANMHLVGPP